MGAGIDLLGDRDPNPFLPAAQLMATHGLGAIMDQPFFTGNNVPVVGIAAQHQLVSCSGRGNDPGPVPETFDECMDVCGSAQQGFCAHVSSLDLCDELFPGE